MKLSSDTDKNDGGIDTSKTQSLFDIPVSPSNHREVERRKVVCLTLRQLDEIAELAANKAIDGMTNKLDYNAISEKLKEHIALEVGKTVISRFFIVVGMFIIALVTLLSKKFDISLLKQLDW